MYLKRIEAKEFNSEELKQVKEEMKQAKDLYDELREVSKNMITALNILRKISAHRGKDMSQWRHQKHVSSPKVQEWVDSLHALGFLNSSTDKAVTDIMKIENEIREYLKI